MLQGEKGCGCTKGTCNPKSKKQCVSCYWKCKPCGIKCKCSASACTNPHNTGLGCIRCKPNVDIDDQGPSSIPKPVLDTNYDEDTDYYMSTDDESDDDCSDTV